VAADRLLLRYRDGALQLSGQAEAAVVGLWERREAGQLNDAQFKALAAGVIAAANARAVTLADLALSAVLTAELGKVIPPLGLLPTDDGPRLAAAIPTLLDRAAGLALPGAAAAERATAERAMVARMARSEPLDAASATFQRGMQRRRVPGWTRGTGPKPCPLCTSLADGAVLSPSTPMARHKGCSCYQIPTERTPR